MAVDDYGIQVLSKAAEQVVSGNKADYFLKVNDANNLLGGIVYDYIAVSYPSATTETYTFKTGGSGGTTVRVITVTYTDSTKENLSSAERTS